ncbi:hypothetical protein LIER_17860 [Lithospermum erythrorhizon]|uniref:Uncharacterized protein n=1 Tax=Lithospermum erythrorhizon TaxID=34254 RepID=A0AAV3QC40_LITER
MALGSMSDVNEETPIAEDSTIPRKKHPKWTIEENLVLLKWQAVRDQPRFASQERGNTGSGSSGSNRAYESDVGKGIALEVVNEEKEKVLTIFKQYKEKESKRLDKIATQSKETLNVMKEKTPAKKMKMWMKLSAQEHLDDRSKQLFEMLGLELFGE